MIPLNDLHRALVIKLRHHGDVLLSSPVFSVLKDFAPQCEIDALVYADTMPMLEGHPAIHTIHTIERGQRGLAQASAEWRLLRALRARHYDLVVHLTEHRRGAWMTRLLAPRWSVAPTVTGRGDFWRNSFTWLFPHPHNARRHMVERNLDSLRRLGIQPAFQQRAVKLVPGAAAEKRIADLLTEHRLVPGAFIHIHPASRWHFKSWTVEGWTQAIDSLTEDGVKVVLTCAPDQAELAMLARINKGLARPVVDLGGRLNLRELAALAGQARAFVGVDSAPMHIAAAMDTPVVALFGPSGEFEWGPWGKPRHGSHRIISSNLPQHSCRPCGLDGCGGGKISDCLVSLDASRVLAPMRELLL